MYYFSQAALVSFLTIAAMTPSPSCARIDIPSLDKGKKGKGREYSIVAKIIMDMDTDTGPEYTSTEIAYFEESLILSTNEAYSAEDFHMSSAATKSIDSGPATFGANLMRRRKKKKKHHQTGAFHFRVSFGYVVTGECRLCGDDFSSGDIITKGGKNPHHQKWEEIFCALLAQNPLLDSVHSCEITVTRNGKEEPVEIAEIENKITAIAIVED
jgi:hypothetical protein